MELYSVFPSLVQADESSLTQNQHESNQYSNAQAASSDPLEEEDYINNLDDMKEFMSIVLKINLCVINPNNKNTEVQKLFESFIPKPNAPQEAN